MKKIRNTVTLIFMLLVFCVNFGVCANDALSVKFSEDASHITFSGKVESGVSSDIAIVILKPGVTYAQYSTLTGMEKALAVHDIRQTHSDDYGNYILTFGFAGDSGTYTAVVSDMDGVKTLEFDYPPVDDNDEIDGNPIDPYTSTQYTPWFTQYNFTTEAQYNAGYHGGEGGQKGFSMAYSPVNTNLLFFGTDTSGIWKSTDGGTSWRISSSGLGCYGTASIMCSKTDANTVYAACCPNVTGNSEFTTDATGIYASYDGGATWTLELATGYYRKHSVSLFAYVGDVLYAASHDGGVYRTAEKGVWEKVYTYDGTINNFTSSGDTLILSTLSNGILISTNGTDWSQASSGFDSENVICTAVNPQDTDTWVSVTPNYMYITENSGTSWTQLKTCSQVRTSLKDSFGGVFFGGVRENELPRLYVQLYNISYPLSYSDDMGSTFSKMTIDTTLGFMSNKTGYDCEPICVHPENSEILMASMDGELYKSTDGGESFFASSSGFSGLRVMDISFNPNDNRDVIYSVMDFGAVRSFDSGEGERYPLAEYKRLRYNTKSASRSVARDPFNVNHILINIGQSSTGYVIMESTDGGDTFAQLDATMDYNSTFIRFNKDCEGVIYAKEIISYDGGKTWQKSDYLIYAVSPINGDIIYGVGDSKLYKSSDMGKTWEYLAEMPGGFQTVTADAKVEDKLYIGLYKGGLRIFENGSFTTVSVSTDGYSMNPIYCVAQDPQDYKHLLAGGANNFTYSASEGLFESYDSGKTWYKVQGLPFGRDIWKVIFHPNLDRAYITTSSGTYIYHYNNYVKSDVVVTNLTEAKQETLDNYSYKLYNVTESYQPVLLISATYDALKTKCPSVTTEDIYLPPMSVLEKKSTISHENGDISELFFWKDFDSLVPYSVVGR